MQQAFIFFTDSMRQNTGYFVFTILLAAAPILAFCLNYKKTVLMDARRIKYLLYCMLAYMALPSALFIISLPGNAALKAAACFVLVVYSVKALNIAAAPGQWLVADEEYVVRLDFLSLFLGLLILVCAGLLYGYGFLFDWPKHRSVLLGLYSAPLNPTLSYFNLPEGDSLSNARLVYYYAMYLPAVYAVKVSAIFFKPEDTRVLAWMLSMFFFVWNMLGVIFAALLMPLACRRLFRVDTKAVWGWAYLVIAGFGNLAYCSPIFMGYIEQTAVAGAFEGILNYNAGLQTFIVMWKDIPAQVVAGLFAVLLLPLYQSRMKQFPLLLWSTFLISSSAFVWITAVPLYLFFLLSESWAQAGKAGFWRELGFVLKKIRLELAATSFIILLVVLFYTGKLRPEAISWNKSLFMPGAFVKYSAFLVIQLWSAGLILLICWFKKISVPALVWLSLAVLTLLPLFEIGALGLNDLCLKGSIPAYLILVLFSAAIIQQAMAERRLVVGILIAAFIVINIHGFVGSYLQAFHSESRFLEYHSQIALQYAGAKNMTLVPVSQVYRHDDSVYELPR